MVPVACLGIGSHEAGWTDERREETCLVDCFIGLICLSFVVNEHTDSGLMLLESTIF